MQFQSLPSLLFFALIAFTSATDFDPTIISNLTTPAAPTPTLAPVPVPANAFANNSDSPSREIGLDKIVSVRTCSAMSQYNFANEFVFACAHDFGTRGYNLLFMRPDTTYAYECGCLNGLDSYNQWDSRWKRSTNSGIWCNTRNGIPGAFWWSMVHQYDLAACSHGVANCDTKTGVCANI